MISTASKPSSLSSEVPCSHGPLAPEASVQPHSVLSPTESFAPATWNKCEWVSLNIWASPRRRHGSLPQNLEKVLFYVCSLRLNEPYQSLPFGRPVGGCPPKFASSLSAWRRLSRSVPSSTHDPAKTRHSARDLWDAHISVGLPPDPASGTHYRGGAYLLLVLIV